MNFGEMKGKCEKTGLGFARLSREAVEGLLERARRVLVRPLASLVPPPLCDCVASSPFSWRFRRQGLSSFGLRALAYFVFSIDNFKKGYYL